MSVLTMPKFTSQILLLFSKVLHILENLLLKFKIKLGNYDESLKNSL